MRVFVAPGPAAVPPLESSARDVLMLDRTLGETMARDLAAAGLQIEPVASLDEGQQRAQSEDDGGFVILDSVISSPTVIRRFVQAARARKGPVALVCALPRAVGTDYLSVVEGLEARAVSGREDPVWTVPFYFVRGASLIAEAEPAVQEYRETVLRFPVPYGILGRSGETIAFGLSESYAFSVSHWIHVLRGNTATMAGWWVKRLRYGYVLGAIWLFWRFLCGFPWWGRRLFAAIRAVAWGARVHYTAVAELSVVQKGATVGANASILNSYIDEGAFIGEGARISGSLIGKGAVVAPNSIVNMCVVYPGAMAGQALMQGSVLGREAAAFTNSNFFDVNFARNIRVAHRGRIVDAGTQMLGVCLGPRARVSAGIWVASGREVPADALLVKPQSEIATNIGRPAPGVAHIVVDGSVVPMTRPERDRRSG